MLFTAHTNHNTINVYVHTHKTPPTQISKKQGLKCMPGPIQTCVRTVLALLLCSFKAARSIVPVQCSLLKNCQRKKFSNTYARRMNTIVYSYTTAYRNRLIQNCTCHVCAHIQTHMALLVGTGMIGVRKTVACHFRWIFRIHGDGTVYKT